MNQKPIDIRKQIRKKRRALPIPMQQECAYELYQRLKNENCFIKSRHIAGYIPSEGEISPEPLMQLAEEMGKTVYLPVLMPFLSNRLWFAPYNKDSIMRNNRFGIPEPVFNGKQLIPATHLDLVLTPLVAFDSQCNRIGMGGGYYDRTFGFLRHRNHWISPKLVGVAYEFQKINQIRSQKWDVPLQMVITEQSTTTNK